MKDAITKAAARVLIKSGLTGWTVDEVARQAGCAKGLVNYHHRTKLELLARVAAFLQDERWNLRSESVGAGQPLDRLWQTLIEDVASGRFSAWLSLLAAPAPVRDAAGTDPTRIQEFSSTLGASLGLGQDLVPRAALISAVLDGLEVRFLEGARPTGVEEEYHRFWLTLLDM